jgi:hypothetical protein
MTCITSNVEEWLANDCTDYARTQGQGFYNDLFNNFYPSGEVFVPGMSSSDSGGIDEDIRFQHLLTDLCTDNKYCTGPLDSLCSKYSRSDMSHPLIRQLCSCHLPQSEYTSDIRACDTICSGYDTVKYYGQSSCQASVCVIDNFTLIAKGSSVGDITFTQACPYCTSSCKCIIGDINIISQDSRLGALNLEQNCGGQIECYADIEGVRTPISDCQQYINSFGLTTSVVDKQVQVYTTYTITFLIAAIILIILFIIGIIFLLKQNRKPEIVKIKNTMSSPSKLSNKSLSVQNS